MGVLVRYPCGCLYSGTAVYNLRGPVVHCTRFIKIVIYWAELSFNASSAAFVLDSPGFEIIVNVSSALHCMYLVSA